MTQKNRIADLFQKYFDRTDTAEERNELMLLISKTDSDKELNALIEDLYISYKPQQSPFIEDQRDKILQNILSGIDGAERKKAVNKIYFKTRWFKYSVAASLLILMTISGYLFTHRHAADTQNVKADFRPGSNKATLTLSDGSTINLDDVHNGKLASEDNMEVNKPRDGEISYHAAVGSNTASGTRSNINNIKTPRGGQYHVILSDGSKVWLNSASSISFPATFTGKERKVKITGEVYFEIAKNKAKPFIIQSGNQLVEVLGTHFNINSYDDEPDIKTTLLEGAVKILQLNTGFTALLKPGQLAINKSSGPILVKKADLEQAVAWKNGLFQVNDVSLETIMRQASRWYDVDVVYQGKIPERKFSGKIKRNVNASEFLQMLAFFNVHFSIEGRTIIVKN